MSCYDHHSSFVIDKIVQINEFLFYNSKFKVVICSICQRCINNEKNTNFSSHFSDVKHKNLSKNEKNEINLELQKYDILAIQHVQIPANHKHFFSYLSIYNDDLQCTKCSKSLRDVKTMRNHINQVHNIKRKFKHDKNNFIENLNVQLFFTSFYRNYFIVSTKNNDEKNDNNQNNENNKTTNFNENNNIDFNANEIATINAYENKFCLLYTSPSPRDLSTSRMPSSA